MFRLIADTFSPCASPSPCRGAWIPRSPPCFFATRATRSWASRCSSGTTPAKPAARGAAARSTISETRAARRGRWGSATTCSISRRSSGATSSGPSSAPTWPAKRRSRARPATPRSSSPRSGSARAPSAARPWRPGTMPAPGATTVSGRAVLRKGRDAAKDQSYFLYDLSEEQLAGARFPVGDLTKSEVRARARAAGLPNADKEESQEICFVPPGTRAGEFVARHATALGFAAPPEAGVIEDAAGGRVGEHAGHYRYTIGQRRGIGIAATQRLYVLEVDARREPRRRGAGSRPGEPQRGDRGRPALGRRARGCVPGRGPHSASRLRGSGDRSRRAPEPPRRSSSIPRSAP